MVIKKIIKVLIFYFILSVLLSQQIFADEKDQESEFGITIGANVWFSWWEPAWSDGWASFKYSSSPIEKYPKYKTNPNILYGPALSILLFGRMNISSVFMYGNYESISKGLYLSKTGGYPINYKKDIRKYDSDTVMSYKIIKYLSIFVGFKYQGYDFDQKGEIIIPGLIIAVEAQSENKAYGPGLGVSIYVPIVENLYGLINISGVVMWGYEKFGIDKAYTSIGTIWPSTYAFYPKGKYLAYGMNSSINLAYLIDKVNITLALGGRYQLLKYKQNYSDVALTFYNKEMDHFYGINFSVNYSLYFGSK